MKPFKLHKGDIKIVGNNANVSSRFFLYLLKLSKSKAKTHRGKKKAAEKMLNIILLEALQDA